MPRETNKEGLRQTLLQENTTNLTRAFKTLSDEDKEKIGGPYYEACQRVIAKHGARYLGFEEDALKECPEAEPAVRRWLAKTEEIEKRRSKKSFA